MNKVKSYDKAVEKVVQEYKEQLITIGWSDEDAERAAREYKFSASLDVLLYLSASKNIMKSMSMNTEEMVSSMENTIRNAAQATEYIKNKVESDKRCRQTSETTRQEKVMT